MTEKITNPVRKLFFGLFIFPLVIAVGMAVLLCSVVLVTNEKETPETLIGAIKSGTPSKRWQKAFELSNELNKTHGQAPLNAGLQKEILYILNDSSGYDEKTRSYMAMALHHFPGNESVTALQKALKDSSQEVQIGALWTLGSLGAKTATSDIESFLTAEKSELRKMAAYILGVLGEKSSVPKIRPLLNDVTPDVQWNAALALARLGDISGYKVLTGMLDRRQFSEAGTQEAQIEAAMINAIKGLTLIQNPESIKIFESISREDKNMKVRQAAIDALNYQKK